MKLALLGLLDGDQLHPMDPTQRVSRVLSVDGSRDSFQNVNLINNEKNINCKT
jgi:hypothetical protein